MYLLEGALRHYAWGSHQELAALRGAEIPTVHPEAEAWFGAHPDNPSPVQGTEGRTLLDHISAHPQQELGEEISVAFHAQLPFLLKLLAAEKPLSLQAHPSDQQAQAGFARENAAGIPLSASHRNYHDDRHKPELIVALTRFDALAGFRPAPQTLRLLDELQVPQLSTYAELLRAEPTAAGIRALMTTLITLPRKTLTSLIDETTVACRTLIARDSEWSDVALTFLDVVSEYGVDAGALCALLLHRVTLEPGEAISIKAGVLHAYLHGVGVEIMANSDNVLRGGLTPKHVDVPELLQVLDFEPIDDPKCQPYCWDSDGDVHFSDYRAPVTEFGLTRVELSAHSDVPLTTEGPCIILVTQGRLRLAQTVDEGYLDIPAGYAAWLGAGEPRPSMRTDAQPATVFVARVPQPTGEPDRTEDRGH